MKKEIGGGMTASEISQAITKLKMSRLRRAVARATRRLEEGDSVEAVATLELALYLPMTGCDRRTIHRATSEAHIGSSERAVALLRLVTFEKPSRDAIESTPEKPKPFRFCANKLKTADGMPRTRTNGELAEDADEMLSLLPDREQLDTSSALGDALTGLMHLAAREKVDFDKVLVVARVNYENEK